MGPVRRELAIVDVQDLDLLVLLGVVGDGVVIEVVELEGWVCLDLPGVEELLVVEIPSLVATGIKIQPNDIAWEAYRLLH